jgi:hypothetical protein
MKAMRKIIITGTNEPVILDDADFEEFSKWKWHCVEGMLKG